MKTLGRSVSLGFWLFAVVAGDRKILADYDADKNGRLDRAERQAARAALKKEQEERERDGEMRRPPVPPGPERREPAKPGVRLDPKDVKSVAESVSLYDAEVLRTIFLDFEGDDWEAELADFSHTDVEVPATMTVDGKTYPGVGVGFRGASSLFGVGPGYKRSFNVSVDAADPKQRLLGYKTLNLLNSHEDPTFLHSVLVSHVARQYLPAPKVNLVRVVINGENWGVYANAQQFDRILVRENFPKPEGGARWKVPGSPQARGGLEYFGSDLEEYKRRFQLKSGAHEEKAWKSLVNLCQVLNETLPDELEARLDPLVALDDKRKPLRSKVLAVPALRDRYLAYVRDVAATWLDWKQLGPIVARYRALIEHEVEIDTRKLSSFEAFRQTTSDEPPPDSGAESRPGPRGPGMMALRAFADQRRKYLLDHPAIKALPATSSGVESRAAPGRDR